MFGLMISITDCFFKFVINISIWEIGRQSNSSCEERRPDRQNVGLSVIFPLFFHLRLHHVKIADEDVRFDVVDKAHLFA